MSLIQVRDLSISYDGKIVVSGLNFDINQGDFLCIFGENGSGKSSLIKAILGLKSTASGHIHFEKDFSRRDIGYMPQKTEVQRDFPASVGEVVMSGCQGSMGLRPFYGKTERLKAASAMERLGITDIKRECYRNLSGGQQQKVLLARALCGADRMILLDEPTTALDPIATAEFYRLISRLHKEEGITVVMVSHDISGALGYSTDILHLGGSEIMFYGKTADYVKTKIGASFTGQNNEGGEEL
ncbi:MAG: metal ABC transporter ATP-binding protein [Clostridia bacterium]